MQAIVEVGDFHRRTRRAVYTVCSLNSFGNGDGLGVYQLIEDVLTQFPPDRVAASSVKICLRVPTEAFATGPRRSPQIFQMNGCGLAICLRCFSGAGNSTTLIPVSRRSPENADEISCGELQRRS